MKIACPFIVHNLLEIKTYLYLIKKYIGSAIEDPGRIEGLAKMVKKLV